MIVGQTVYYFEETNWVQNWSTKQTLGSQNNLRLEVQRTIAKERCKHK